MEQFQPKAHREVEAELIDGYLNTQIEKGARRERGSVDKIQLKDIQ